MLHPVPDSTQRRRLLRVVALQRRLIARLCALPDGAAVDQAWLAVVWRELPAEWINSFWNNDKKNRRQSIETLAAASIAEKARLIVICREQLRFRLLWEQGGALTIQKADWSEKSSPAFAAAKRLLKSFYAPLFYDDNGYVLKGGDLAKSGFLLSDFLTGFGLAARKVCPYCDNYLQKTELDHFLPQDEFPFLSCHPDNLIPSCPDSNSIGRKGIKVPLDWNAPIQSANWFHPRWRSAVDRVQVKIEVTPARLLNARLIPQDSADAARVTNLDGMFKLSEFWSAHIHDELQLIGSQVSTALQEEAIDPDEAVVTAKLKTFAALKRLEIGKRALAISHAALYQFAAETPFVVRDILRQCQDQLRYQCA